MLQGRLPPLNTVGAPGSYYIMSRKRKFPSDVDHESRVHETLRGFGLYSVLTDLIDDYVGRATHIPWTLRGEWHTASPGGPLPDDPRVVMEVDASYDGASYTYLYILVLPSGRRVQLITRWFAYNPCLQDAPLIVNSLPVEPVMYAPGSQNRVVTIWWARLPGKESVYFLETYSQALLPASWSQWIHRENTSPLTKSVSIYRDYGLFAWSTWLEAESPGVIWALVVSSQGVLTHLVVRCSANHLVQANPYRWVAPCLKQAVDLIHERTICETPSPFWFTWDHVEDE